MGSDHGVLFQKTDRCRIRSDQIDYEYVAQHPEEDVSVSETAFVRPLSRILPRLNLVGHTIDAAREEYEAIVRESLEIAEDDDSGCERNSLMSFDEFCAFVCRQPISSLDDTAVDYQLANRDEVAKGHLASDEAEISRIPRSDRSDLYWSERTYFGERVCILNPYSMLQVFGQHEGNAGASVTWHFGPLIDSGWENEKAFRADARRDQTMLIATEGTSDSRILAHALALMRPDIADFFRFVDLEEPHPFWGAGNLVKFAEGLVRIDVHNKVIFLLDNDGEGRDAYRRLQRINLPPNMRAMLLPDCEAFRHFPARGPDGVSVCDINGRAAAIECYLDLSHPAAEVQWINYKKEIDDWHGALVNKRQYADDFMRQTTASIQRNGYDMSKINEVLKALVKETETLAVDVIGAEG
jgi:HEPN/Toprim N-terminal domain 1